MDGPHVTDEPTTADTTHGIKTALTTIRRNWSATRDPARPGGTTHHTPPTSRPPGNTNAISLRAEVTRDLAYWCHAWLDHHPNAIPAGQTLHCDDVPAMTRFLEQQAQAISGWTYAQRLWAELEDHARDIRNLAAPKHRTTMYVGDCPNPIGTGPAALLCGTRIRANAANPGSVRCRGCGLTDTIDGWILRMVGHEKPVTIPQLVPILHRRLGIVVHERTLRRWYRRGDLVRVAGTEQTPRFDRRAVLAVAMHLSEVGRGARA